MSSRFKPKPGGFRSDIHRLLLAAEAGQKTDILTYSSGHLGPRCLNQSQIHRETNKSFWRMSQSLEETPNPLAPQQTQTKALTSVKKKEMKACLSEFSTGTALVESEVSRSRQDEANYFLSHADKKEDLILPKIVYCSSNSQQKAFTQKKSNSSTDPEEKQHPDQKGLNKEGRLKTKQRFGRQVIAKQNLWAGINIAEMHDRKLQKELRRLSAQSWPSRDRLAVFSDVFDDVCEGSPVFGRILREIKTDYDSYVNHLMASHGMSLDTSLKDLANGKVSQMELEDAEKEVCSLEQEAGRALQENIRVRNKSQNVPATVGPEDSDTKNTCLSGLQDRGTNSVQSKRLQVLNTWREIQHLEEEMKETPVSSVTNMATERPIKDLKTEIIRLIASNERLKITNKDLEDNINMVLNREKASEAIRRMLWDEIPCDLQTESFIGE
ncbi:uncharacterized protein C6orf118-like isoform X2 [Cottoperca gobio]|uniref:Uncharacterized protein C6orf118-like isoform X2 n=1 Tax=Cottoperca gobio TaxID=56716 RepID=A0A6J2RAB4_COTGO|nr:uncharacterized protein C6orf118 homolog isoform X2 [Cottoperca gobio]